MGDTAMERKHIIISGDRHVGKTTLVNKLIAHVKVPVHGFFTRAEKPDADNLMAIYMYAADDNVREKSEDNCIGRTQGRIKMPRTEVFDDLGVRLLSDHKDGIIVMDELGYLESLSEAFRTKVMECLDGDIPVIAAVKNRDITFLNDIRNHPNVLVREIDQKNRDELYEELRGIIESWNL